MEIKWVVILVSFLYLVLLFLIAIWAERHKDKKWLAGSTVYALSLAVYCTAWTYYGSVGRAANQGLDFLTTYIGPVLMAPLLFVLLRKIIRICKAQRITTLSDFIASRYGKNIQLGALVAVVCCLAIIPYMSIQLKAISNSFTTLTQDTRGQQLLYFNDTSFYITIVLGVFTILFGAKNLDANTRNIGLISVIAFESLFKLAAFLILGLYITFGLFNGFDDVFQQASLLPNFNSLITLDGDKNGYSNWFWLNTLSMMAVILLPRQFHVSVKENRSEDHLKKAIWLFPLYLLIINIFVIPIAMGGNILFQSNPIDADTYVLAIPLSEGQQLLAVIAYLGGFAAATSMIIISASALGIMVSNSLITPIVLGNNWLKDKLGQHLNIIVLRSRQLMIIFLLLASYLYFKFIGERFSLVSIGLISFVGVAQFAPALFGGLFWKDANAKASISAIIVGIILWMILLVIPTTLESNLISFLDISWLKSDYLIGLEAGDFIARGFMWSILGNSLVFLGVSNLTKKSSQETNQAEVFVDIFKYSTRYESAILWKGKANLADIRKLLHSFIGQERTDRALKKFSRQNEIIEDEGQADFRIVNYAEKLLSGAVGSASARVLISSIAKEDKINLDEVFGMLKETQRFISDNKELKQKSVELEEAGKQLARANEELRKSDLLKDEFISTVTHEMRTPLTSIRAMSEILSDHEDLEVEEKNQFLTTILNETKRMDRLIGQVLDLEKMQSGKMDFPLKIIDINKVVHDAVNSMQQVFTERNIEIQVEYGSGELWVQANYDRILQVVLNLLSNAAKFAKAEAGEISIITEADFQEVSCTVMDNGRGIDNEAAQLIFQPFYQAENQTLKKPEGTGLGLTISRSIIETHNGLIKVDNVEEGSSISFKLPKVRK